MISKPKTLIVLTAVLVATIFFAFMPVEKIYFDPAGQGMETVRFVDGSTGEDVSEFIDHVEFYRYDAVPPLDLLANATTMTDIKGAVEGYEGDADVALFFVMSYPYSNRWYMSGETEFYFYEI